MRTNNQFVLEAIETTSECIVADIDFAVDSIEGFFNLIKIEPQEFRENMSYPLDTDVVVELIRDFALKFEPGSAPVWIRARTTLDDLPYKLHTGRELLMMLAETKPMAAFCGPFTKEPCPIDIPEHLFDPYVAHRRFIKYERIYELRAGPNGCQRPLNLRRVVYTLPAEAWRAHAYFLLCETAEKTGWDETLTRLEGSLLGYEQWQNDVFIESVHRPGIVRQA